MTESGVIPPPEDRILHYAGPVLTDWHVAGEIRCPDCGRHFAADCRLEDVVRFTGIHGCVAGRDAPVPP